MLHFLSDVTESNRVRVFDCGDNNDIPAGDCSPGLLPSPRKSKLARPLLTITNRADHTAPAQGRHAEQFSHFVNLTDHVTVRSVTDNNVQIRSVTDKNVQLRHFLNLLHMSQPIW
jgi:hypothetical protein